MKQFDGKSKKLNTMYLMINQTSALGAAVIWEDHHANTYVSELFPRLDAEKVICFLIGKKLSFNNTRFLISKRN